MSRLHEPGLWKLLVTFYLKLLGVIVGLNMLQTGRKVHILRFVGYIQP